MDWEMIGKVRLNYTYYTGEDSYSDGPVEDTLLALCRQGKMEEALISNTAWPILYHLSPVRQNILEWYPMKENASVLEIGSGCGAITGILSKKAEKLTCIELSRKRSQINAWQNRECDNVEIYVGKYEDVRLSGKFDYITLVGVLEYAGSYTAGRNPFCTLLEQVRSMLKPDGKILIAIENRMGLKYLNGAKEDHSRNLFEGVHDYPSGNHVRTFTRPELSTLLSAAGLPFHKFYYPMPDYKMPSMILSDAYQVNQGVFHGMSAPYDAPRVCFFQEDLVWDTLAKDGEFGYFANSFFVEAGMTDDLSDILYVKYSRLRKKEFQTRILISRNPKDGKTAVYKYALCQEGAEHMASHAAKCEELKKVFRNLSVVDSIMTEDGGIASPYIEGVTVNDILFRYRGCRDELITVIQEYLNRILDFREEYLLPFESGKAFEEIFGMVPWGEQKAVRVADIDCAFDNIIERPDGSLYLFDYEWTFPFPVPVVYLKFRMLYWWYRRMSSYLPFTGIPDFMYSFGFSSEELDLCVDMDNRFMQYMRTDPQAPVFSLDRYKKEALRLDTVCHTVADYQEMYRKSSDYESLERKLEMHKKNEERLRKRIL